MSKLSDFLAERGMEQMRDAQRAYSLGQMTHTDSYQAQPYAWGEGIPQAIESGLRKGPGTLMELVDSYSPIGRVYNVLSGDTFQRPIDEFMGVNDQAYNPADYPTTNQYLLGGLELVGMMVTDPLNLMIPGVAYADDIPRLARMGFDNLMQPGMNRGTFNQLGMIGGPGAKTAKLDLLEQAKTMKADGADADSIYQSTGWWLDHPDGVPRFEIDDSGFVFNPPYREKVINYESGQYASGRLLPGKSPIREVYSDMGLSDEKMNQFIADNPHLGETPDSLIDLPSRMGAEHPQLTNAYPDLYKINAEVSWIPVKGGAYEGDYKGAVDWLGQPERIRMWGGKHNDIKSGVAHELQHAIQSREGMARGGSPEMFSRDFALYNTEMQALGLKDIADFLGEGAKREDIAKEYIGLYGSEPDMDLLAYAKQTPREELQSKVNAYYNKYGLNPKPYEAYKRLAGEAEARLVQDRMNMSMDERLANPFYKGYDVPLEDQIIRMDDGPSLSTEPLGNTAMGKSQLGAIGTELPMDEASRMARELPKISEKSLQSGHGIGDRGGRTFGGATVFHSTDDEGIEAISRGGFDVVGEGYYGEAISFTDDIDYSRNFGDKTLVSTVKQNAKILDVSTDEGFEIWADAQRRGVPIASHKRRPTDKTWGELIKEAGYDGLYDDGAGDLFIYNPDAIELKGILDK